MFYSVGSYAQKTTIQTIWRSNEYFPMKCVVCSPKFYLQDFGEQKIGESFTVKDSTYNIELSIKDNIVIRLEGAGIVRYLFVTPGDNIYFTINKPENSINYDIQFTGTNSAHYNYEYRYNRKPLYYNKGMELLQFKEQLIALCNDERTFLKQYCEENSCSPEFYHYKTDDINNFYIAKLLSTKNSVNISEFPDGYFDSLPRPRNPLSANYDNAMYSLYIDESDFEGTINRIEHELSGEEQELLRMGAIRHFAYMQGDGYKDAFMEYAKEIAKNTSISKMKNYITSALNYYMQVGNPIPKQILQSTTLKDYDGKQLTLEQLLEKHRNKAIYIDFWASWCVGCRQDITESKQSKEWLASKGVVYIYLAYADKDDAWRKAAQEEAITDNQYSLDGDKQTPIRQYLNFYSIPHYVILDTEHKIVVNGASRPTPDRFETLKSQFKKIVIEQEVIYY